MEDEVGVRNLARGSGERDRERKRAREGALLTVAQLDYVLYPDRYAELLSVRAGTHICASFPSSEGALGRETALYKGRNM